MNTKELLSLVTEDYQLNNRRSIRHVENSIRHLLDHLGSNTDVGMITARCIKDYAIARSEAGAANATINRDLAVVKRAFHIACEQEQIDKAPVIHTLKEDNVREGCVEHDEYLATLSHLRTPYREVYIFGYFKGWRVGEILNVRKSWVDLDAGVLRLPHRYSKNGDGRPIGLEKEIREALARCMSLSGTDFVFGLNGRRLSGATTYRRMKEAFILAGHPDRVFHDLRRTATRNMLRAGIHEKLAMQVTGHKTRSVFDRYNIVNEKDLIETAHKTEVYFSRQKKTDQSGGILRSVFDFFKGGKDS